MDTSLLQVTYLSVFIVILLGLLAFLFFFWSKAKKSGFQSRRLDDTSKLLSYDQMLRQGKISKEEYRQIQHAMLKKHDFTPEQPKNNETKEE